MERCSLGETEAGSIFMISSFSHGLYLALGLLSSFQIMLFYFVAWQCTKKMRRLSLEKTPPMKTFSEALPEKIGHDVKDFTSATETCDWFNTLLSSIYFDHVGSENIRQMILESITADFHELQGEYPTLLDGLEVDHFSLGSSLPELRNVRIRSTNGLKTDMFLIFDLSYNGGASIGVKITSFGKSMHVGVTLSRIEGKLIAEVIDWPVPCIQTYFYTEPKFNFSLQFGDQKFKWFAEVVTQKIKQFLIKKIVYPHGHTYHFTTTGQDWHASVKRRFPSLGDVLNQPGTLIVHIYDGEKIIHRGHYSCQLKIGKQKNSTKVAKKTSSPSWNETFCFDLRKQNLNEGSLILKLYENNHDRVMGAVEIPLVGLRTDNPHFQTFPFLSEVGPFDKVGSVQVGYLLSTADKTNFLDEISKFSKKTSMSETPPPGATYDAHFGGYVMITDGEKEDTSEPPSLSFLQPKRASLGGAEKLHPPDMHKKSFSLLNVIRHHIEKKL